MSEKKTTPSPAEVLVNGFREAKDKQAYVDGVEKAAKVATDFECLSAVYASGVKEFKIAQNVDKAKNFLNEGAKVGSTACMISLADSIASEEPSKARSLLDAALTAKDMRAANSLGVLAMRSGDVDGALAKFELAESHGVPNAANNLLVTRLQKASTVLAQTQALLAQALRQFARPASQAAATEEKKTEEKKETENID